MDPRDFEQATTPITNAFSEACTQICNGQLGLTEAILKNSDQIGRAAESIEKLVNIISRLAGQVEALEYEVIEQRTVLADALNDRSTDCE